MTRASTLALLRANHGFTQPDEHWVGYAEAHRFQAVSVTARPLCPDCGGDSHAGLGQFIYYSSLFRLLVCAHCDLAWSDGVLDPAVVHAHFDATYKDRAYFLTARAAIFRHLTEVIDRVTPIGGTVLDMGGAQGDLMGMVVRRRPDLAPVVQDVSSVALAYARTVFGLETLREVAEARTFTTVVLSDVLYYEPDLANFWRRLPSLVEGGGTVILRVPNKRWRLRLAWWLHDPCDRTQDRLSGFNPEHLYSFSLRYLRDRFTQGGFAVQTTVSPLLGASWWRRAVFQGARVVSTVTRGRVLLTPGVLVIGTRRAR